MKMPAAAAIAILILGLATSAPAQTTGSFIWTQGSMTTVRVGHTATLLQDGRVLLTGGRKFTMKEELIADESAELYDPTTGTFAATGSMRVPRWFHTAILMADGRVLVVGGCVCSAEIYDPATGTFSTTGSLTLARSVSGAALLKDGKVLVVGYMAIERYDPVSGTFTLTNENVGEGNAVSLLDGRVFVGDTSAAKLYNPTTNDFETVAPGTTLSRYWPNPATPLPNGQILFAGGSSDPYGEAALSDVTLYNPSTGAFQQAGHLNVARAHHAITLLKDGRVLITGGYNGNGPVELTGTFSSVELYDPATRTVTNLPGMILAREGHTATLLQDGRVLIAGGVDASGLASAELYVPDNVRGPLPQLSMNSSQYCLGESWHMQVSGAQPSSNITLMGSWNRAPWSIPGWGTTTADGTYASDGTFDDSSGGNHMLWVLAGDKVSKTVSLNISACRVGLNVESAFRIGFPWVVRVSSNLRDAVVTLDGSSNGVPWQIPVWGRTQADGSFVETGAFPVGVEGDHELRVRVGGEVSRIFRFRVQP